MLASLEEAAVLAKSGDHKKAAAAYQRIAQENSIAPAFRGLAELLSVIRTFPTQTPRQRSPGWCR